MSLDHVLQAINDAVPVCKVNIDIRKDIVFYNTVAEANKIVGVLEGLGGFVQSNDPITYGSSTNVAVVELDGHTFNVWYEKMLTKEEKIAELQKQIDEIRGLE